MEKLSDLLEMAKVSDIITKKEKEDNKICLLYTSDAADE